MEAMTAAGPMPPTPLLPQAKSREGKGGGGDCRVGLSVAVYTANSTVDAPALTILNTALPELLTGRPLMVEGEV